MVHYVTSPPRSTIQLSYTSPCTTIFSYHYELAQCLFILLKPPSRGANVKKIYLSSLGVKFSRFPNPRGSGKQHWGVCGCGGQWGGGRRRSKNSTDRRRNYLNFDFKENGKMLGNKFKKKKNLKFWNSNYASKICSNVSQKD